VHLTTSTFILLTRADASLNVEVTKYSNTALACGTVKIHRFWFFASAKPKTFLYTSKYLVRHPM
jgi:hypothetical protein